MRAERDPGRSRAAGGRGVGHVEWSGWVLLDAYEQSLGEPHGRERVKLVPREDMLRVMRGEG